MNSNSWLISSFVVTNEPLFVFDLPFWLTAVNENKCFSLSTSVRSWSRNSAGCLNLFKVRIELKWTFISLCRLLSEFNFCSFVWLLYIFDISSLFFVFVVLNRNFNYFFSISTFKSFKKFTPSATKILIFTLQHENILKNLNCLFDSH